MIENAYDKLYEAGFENRVFAKGEVKFKQTSLTDPHIIKVMQIVAKHLHITEQQVADEIQKGVAKIADLEKITPLLYGTMAQNKIEGELFRLIEKIGNGKPIEGTPQFEKHAFYDLVDSIRAEQSSFYPLKSLYRNTRLYDVNMKILSKEDVQDELEKLFAKQDKITGAAKKALARKIDLYKQLGTAAATPDGLFYFNQDFMQALMNWAHIVELKPKGKKYICNGGETPDEYAYIEFVIMHEFMHYTYDDFYYQKKIPKANNQIINWAGDFRTNYILVKSGYEQIPIGLFNDELNLDRCKDYADLYNQIVREMNKLPKDARQAVAEELDDNTDDHDPGQEEGADDESVEDENGTEAPPPPPPGPKGPKQPKQPYYVEDRVGNLTINGRDMLDKNKRVPGQTVFANIPIGPKQGRWDEQVVPTPGGPVEVLVIDKKNYHINANGDIVVRVKKAKGVV